VWRNWRKALVVVRPDMVVRWQRERFRRYWTHLSKPSGKPGRPAVRFAIRELIRTMALANGLWRAPRIHGGLQKPGIEVSERTCVPHPARPPSQTWKMFLHNHIGEVVAVDFFSVPTIRLRFLFVFLVMEHQGEKFFTLASRNAQRRNGQRSKSSKPLQGVMPSIL
jgi:putative transposase